MIKYNRGDLMYTYQSNHYSSMINQIIDDCITSSQEHPFELHYVIVDDQKYIEEIFLKKTDALFNIEVITIQQFFNIILEQYHQTFHKKSNLDNILEIMKLNKEDPSSLFHHSQNQVLTAKQILNVFTNFYLYNIQETNENLPDLSKNKIKTLFHLYHQFDQVHFLEHDFITSLIDSSCHHYYYFLTRNFSYPKALQIINKLDNYGHVFIYDDTVGHQGEDYTSYLVNHLFDSLQIKKELANPYEILCASSIQEEVKQVVFDINQLLSHHHLSDFAIYIPNDDYYEHLTLILDRFHFAYNQKEKVENRPFQVVLMLLNYLINHDEQYLLDAISSMYLSSFQDIQYIARIKKIQYTQGFINDENYIHLKQDLLCINAHTVCKLSKQLIEFIQNHFIHTEDIITLITKLDLTNEDDITLNEYLNLLKELFSLQTAYHKEKIDSLYILNYQQPYSELLNVQYIYCLGLNETIVPQEFKNTELLLNHEASALNYPTTYDQLHHQQCALQHLFSNHHQRIILSYALRDLTGNDLVVSSLIKKVKKLLSVRTFKKHQLLHPALKQDYYLLGEEDKQMVTLNQQLLFYKQNHHQVNPLLTHINPNPLSASKLEVYNQCPYKYYVQYILKVDPFVDSSIQSNEIGTLVHYVLEKNHHYFNDNQAVDFSNLKTDISRTIHEYLHDHELPKYKLPQNQFILQLIEDDLYNTIIVLNKQMARGLFSLQTCEQKVYEKIDDIELKGFIDRVDFYQNYIKVIDYKSSNKELNLELAKLGFNMQMLIYLDILSKNKQYDKGAVLYFNTKKRILKSELSILEKEKPENFFKLYQMDGYCLNEIYQDIDRDMDNESDIIKVKLKKDGSPYQNAKLISQEDLSDILRDIAKHIQDLYDQMISGDISIYPTRSDQPAIDQHINPCRFCHYRPLCNYDIFYNENHMIEQGENNEER